jgi:hypothetical protein
LQDEGITFLDASGCRAAPPGCRSECISGINYNGSLSGKQRSRWILSILVTCYVYLKKKNFDFHRGWKPAAKPQPLDCSPLEGYLKTTSNQMIWLNIAEDIITGSYIGQVPSKN